LKDGKKQVEAQKQKRVGIQSVRRGQYFGNLDIGSEYLFQSRRH
jgi:hypothetical protein